MRLFKRFGAALLTVLTLTAVFTGPVLAAEPGVGNGNIAVQLDGKDLAFTDAVPEITSDRTFLPFRAVLEAMGAEVGYDAETSTVSAQKGGVTMSMIPGQTTLTITADGQTRTETMDVAPYIKASNNRTYIPVRYAAEAFGYSVGWDQDNKTVILVDVEALFGDATFTLLDSLSDYLNKQGDIENMALTGNLTLDMTDKIATSLTGPLSIKGSLEGVVGKKGVQLAGKVDGAAIALFMASTLGGPVDAEALQALPEVSAELRVNLDAKTLYASIPDILTGGMEAENVWYSLDLSAFEAELLSLIDMDQLAQLEDAGVREALVYVMKNLPLEDRDMSYATLAQLAQLYVGMFSDQAFTQNGDVYTAKSTLEDLIDLEVTLTKQGDDVTAMDVTMTAVEEESGLKMTMTAHAASDKVDIAMDLSVEDETIKVVFRLDLECVPTDKVPETALPAGVQVTPIA